MSTPNGRRKDRAGELDDTEARLRGLLTEAHGTVRDLDRLLREARNLVNDNAKAAADASFRSASEEMNRFSAHFQRQMNAAAQELNAAVSAARDQVIDAIAPEVVSIDPETGFIAVRFAGALFDAQVPVADLGPPKSVPP